MVSMDGGYSSVVSKTNLPWVEKYRPDTLDEIISHKDIISTIDKFLETNRLPHLLFYGPPGTGKTTTILAIARKLYTKEAFNSMVLELNASDDRGIGVVRQQILSFASTKTIFTMGSKLVILDEADAMTKDAQNALRRIIEKYTQNVRFCLICNYLSKIIPAIQSRCTRFRFAPLTTEQMLPRLEYVVKTENLFVSQDGIDALLRLSDGDMRKVLNVLQASSMARISNDESSTSDSLKIDENLVYTVTGHPLRHEIESIVRWLLNEPFTDTFKNVFELKVRRGLALQDIIEEVHDYVHRIEFPLKVRLFLLKELAEIEYRLAVGANEKLQLSGLISVFSDAKEMVFEQKKLEDQQNQEGGKDMSNDKAE